MKLYDTHNVELSDSEEMDELDALIEKYVEKVYNDTLPEDFIIPELYFHNAINLMQGYEQGYEKQFFGTDWSVKDNDLLNCVQNNIFAFSGAKSMAQMIELRDNVYVNGKLQTWSDFKHQARQINSKYNLTYLKVERQAVIAAGTAGSRWLDFQESMSTHPYLEYMTANNDRVREEHRKLHGLIYPIDDAFWSKYSPPNGWRCHCYLNKLTEREYLHKKGQYKGGLPDTETAQKMAGHNIGKEWRHNVGESKIVFKDEHPYFQANSTAREKQFSATKNYGMKSVEKIYLKPDKLSLYKGEIKNEKAYNHHWDIMEQAHGKSGEGFTLVDKKNKISARFDNDLKKKILERERHTYFDEAIEVFSRPDEVWGVMKSGNARGQNIEFFNVYIKYYKDKPIILLVNKDGRVDSFYKMDSKSQYEDFRIGILKQKR